MVGVCLEVRDFENTIGFQPLFLGDKKLAYYNTTKPLLISAVSASLSLWSLDRRHSLSSFHLVFMRKLKFHEQKLLKKVDFLQWKSDRNIREIKVLRRYLLQNRDDYAKYDKLAGLIKKLTARLKTLDPSDEFRMKMTEQLLNKLYSMGVINAKTSLAKTESVTVSAFCRRRLPVVMVRLKMSQTLSQAATFIEQGHVRVGPHAVTDPAYLVTRSMEDFVTWVDSSKIKRTIKTYEDKLDDFDLLGEG